MLSSTDTLGRVLVLNQANLQAYPEGASNIQTSIGSRNSAIHNAYCILLHSSSSIELRHSLQNILHVKVKHISNATLCLVNTISTHGCNCKPCSPGQDIPAWSKTSKPQPTTSLNIVLKETCANDPSAGSPTETLLRLLLPLSDKVH